MSISFNTPFNALATIGLSVGDIATLAGAGRAVGTWLRAQYLDRSLLELVNIEDVIPRPGLVNIAELEERWSKRLVLFQDGRLLPLHEKDAREVLKKVKLDRFTWVMTLLTAALLAATSQQCMEHVLLDVLTDRCKDSDGYEYLVRDLPRNIESWMSTARTRTIARTANDRWTALGIEGIHVVGQIPEADSKGGKHDKSFRTASSDVYAFAVVLQSIGIDLLQCGRGSADESRLSIVLDTSRLAHGSIGTYPKRRGMRINLTNIEECVTLWPGPAQSNNHRRAIFLSAMRPSKLIKAVAATCMINRSWDVPDDLPYSAGPESRRPAVGFKFCPAFRLSNAAAAISKDFLLAPDKAVCEALAELIQSWRLSDKDEHRIVTAVTSSRSSLPKTADRYLADLQVFLLGHYYGVLASLMDTSQMIVREAWGSWTWNDLELLELIKANDRSYMNTIAVREVQGNPWAPKTSTSRCSGLTKINYSKTQSSGLTKGPRTRDRSSALTSVDYDMEEPDTFEIWEDGGPTIGDPQIAFWFRPYVLKLVAYLFAGAGMKQIQNVGTGCCGIKGKLTAVDYILLGAADDTSQICKFALLDIDDTVFPSNSLGLLHGGGQDQGTCTPMENTVERELSSFALDSRTEDFTSLVEPKWDFDANTCVIAYRRRGRLVHKLDAVTIYNQILDSSRSSRWIDGGHGLLQFAVDGIFTANVAIVGENRGQLIYWEHDTEDHSTASKMTGISLERYDGCQVPLPLVEREDLSTRALGYVATNGLRKTRTCIASLYNLAAPEFKSEGMGGTWCPDYPSGSLIINLNSRLIVVQ